MSSTDNYEGFSRLQPHPFITLAGRQTNSVKSI